MLWFLIKNAGLIFGALGYCLLTILVAIFYWPLAVKMVDRVVGPRDNQLHSREDFVKLCVISILFVVLVVEIIALYFKYMG